MLTIAIINCESDDSNQPTRVPMNGTSCSHPPFSGKCATSICKLACWFPFLVNPDSGICPLPAKSHLSPSCVRLPPSSLYNPLTREMLGDCFRRGRILAVDGGSDSVLDPVLMVSGIGGSILNARNRKNGFQTRAWVRISLANFEFKKYLWSLYNPKTGYTESLDKNVEIVVPEDDYGLHAIDNLDPSMLAKCLHLTDVYHFHDMINMLIGCGYKKGTTLFGYGYDFRQSNWYLKSM